MNYFILRAPNSCNRQKIQLIVFLILLLIISNFGSINSKENGIGQTGANFLRMVNQPVSNAMGDCAINFMGEGSALYNPGSLGLYHLEKSFSIAFPHSTEYAPQFFNELYLKSFSISLGTLIKHTAKTEKGFSGMSVGFSYSRLAFDYGLSSRVGEYGEDLGTYKPYDQADYITFGFGIDYCIKAGIGTTYKRIKSVLNDDLRSDGNAFDIGIIIELPIEKFIKHNNNYAPKFNKFKFEVKPTIALVVSNLGKGLSYIDADQDDPLPKLFKFGLSSYQSLKFKKSVMLSSKFIYEHNRDLKGRPDMINKFGIELGLVDIVFIRLGKYTQDALNEDVKTRGFGLSSSGFISWLRTAEKINVKNKFWCKVISNLNISYDVAVYYDTQSIKDEMKFAGFCFSF